MWLKIRQIKKVKPYKIQTLFITYGIDDIIFVWTLSKIFFLYNLFIQGIFINKLNLFLVSSIQYYMLSFMCAFILFFYIYLC